MQSFPYIFPEVISLKSELLEVRRYLHENPELGSQEFKTAIYILSYLEKLKGLEILKGVGKTGVVAILRGPNPGPTILLRADMDALPIQEETDLPFQSKTPGIHHACGHDGHVAILLVATKVITQKFADKLKGTIKFVFQPSEEIDSGALDMINDPKFPVLENPSVDEAYGLHLMSILERGKIELSPGFFSCFGCSFSVKVKGVGGHGSAPHLCKDPIFIAVQVLENFYAISARDVNPCNKVTLTVGSIHAGKADNVIPSECEFSGTFRCVEESDVKIMRTRMEEIVKGFRLSFGVEIELTCQFGFPGIYNHPEQTRKLINVTAEIVGKENIGDLKYGLYAEDFAFFTQKTKGAYLMVGAALEGSIKENKMVMHHHPKFTFNEDAMEIGVSIWVKLVEKMMI